MCRVLVFTGTCTRCKNKFTWDELSQELSCLEAKNSGFFGQCRRGIVPEYHEHEQECDSCAALASADEGVGGMNDDWVADEETMKHAEDATARGRSKDDGSSRRDADTREDEDDGRMRKRRRV